MPIRKRSNYSLAGIHQGSSIKQCLHQIWSGWKEKFRVEWLETQGNGRIIHAIDFNIEDKTRPWWSQIIMPAGAWFFLVAALTLTFDGGSHKWMREEGVKSGAEKGTIFSPLLDTIQSFKSLQAVDTIRGESKGILSNVMTFLPFQIIHHWVSTLNRPRSPSRCCLLETDSDTNKADDAEEVA